MKRTNENHVQNEGRHNEWKPRPMHHLTLRLGRPRRDVGVYTDFPITRKNSKAYSAEMVEFVAMVEADVARRRARPRTLGAAWER